MSRTERCKRIRYTLFKMLLLHKKKFILNKSGQYLDNLKQICRSLITKLKNLDLILIEITPIFYYFLDISWYFLDIFMVLACNHDVL